MEALKIENSYTIDYIDSLPNGERVELIDGQIYNMSAPSRRHQEILGTIFNEISNFIQSKHGKCKVYVSPFAVFLNDDDKNYVEPDISVICDNDKLTDKGCNGAPDLIIEIVSPGSRHMDYFIKLFKYRSAGVKEYWIVDYEKERVTIYDFVNETSEEYAFGDEIPVSIYNKDLKLKVE